MSEASSTRLSESDSVWGRTPSSSFGDDCSVGRQLTWRAVREASESSSLDEESDQANGAPSPNLRGVVEEDIWEGWVLLPHAFDTAKTSPALKGAVSLSRRRETRPTTTDSTWIPLSSKSLNEPDKLSLERDEEAKKLYRAYERLIDDVSKGDLAAVKKLIDDGLTNLYVPLGGDAHTPLMMAIEGKHDDIALLLIERARPSQLQMQDTNGNTALMLAVIHGRDKVVKRLLRRVKPKQLQTTNHHGQSALSLALDNHRIPITRYLLVAGADVPNEKGYSALMAAVAAEKSSSIDILIKAGTMINQAGPGNISPLSLAIGTGDPKLVNKLLIAGADPDGPDACSDSLLMVAVRGGNEAIVHALLLQGASVGCANDLGVTALHIAAKKGNVRIVSLLIDHGADLAFQDTEGITALHVAAHYGNTKVAKLMLDHHAPIESTDKCGRTPLHHAAKFGGSASCKLFLDRGANIDARDNDGTSVISMARMADDPESLVEVNHYYRQHRPNEQSCAIL